MVLLIREFNSIVAGIGAAISRMFVERGAKHVAILDTDSKSGQTLSKELNKSGEVSSFYVTDVSSETDVKMAVDSVLQKFQRVDVLVCMAAAFVYARCASRLPYCPQVLGGASRNFTGMGQSVRSESQGRGLRLQGSDPKHAAHRLWLDHPVLLHHRHHSLPQIRSLQFHKSAQSPETRVRARPLVSQSRRRH